MKDKQEELRENFLKTVESNIRKSEKETWLTPKHLLLSKKKKSDESKKAD